MAAIGGSIGLASAFEGGYGRIILTASDSTQFAWEGDAVIGETDNSVFTQFLIKGLEGEADRDGDGRISVDELYDYVYEKVKLTTPRQTPSMFSSKQQGEIILRDNIKIESTKPLPLPDDLVAEINHPVPFIRETAVNRLEKLLKAKNLQLAHSARIALERIAAEDDSRRIAHNATKALASIRQTDKSSDFSQTEKLRREKTELAEPIQAERAKLLLEKIELEKRLQEERFAREKAEIQQKTAKTDSTKDELALLPGGLIVALNDPLPTIREGAVRELELLLDGKDPSLARSARIALDRIVAKDDSKRVVRVATEALRDPVQKLIQYANAKIVLVGDTGVGKSGLALVLTNQIFVPTESTHGRRVLKFESTEVGLPNNRKELRETILWDLAGQPGYRLIHQLDLQDVAIALIVFDARSEVNPISGVAHWVRALHQNDNAQDDTIKVIKYLVAARADRGVINMSRAQIDQFLQKNGFQGYFETSAKEGLNIVQLSETIRQAIDWDSLPKVSSNLLFERIKNFLNEEKLANRVLSTIDDLYRAFAFSQNEIMPSEDLRVQFDICLRRVEALGILRLLSFGNFVLMQPEVLVSYASALVNIVKSDPDGLGSILEEKVRQGDFFVPKDERIQDRKQEKILLIAMVEDLLKHEIALREGLDLVFPTQLTRENPELSNPEEESIVFEFEGPVLNIYATLIVRLSHSDIFRKKELWKNGATFASRTRGLCGIFLIDYEDGRGKLKLFYDDFASEETRFQFEEYVRVHIERLAISGTINRERIFVCDKCKTPFSDLQVVGRRKQGFNWIKCTVCDDGIHHSLLDGEARLGMKPKSRVDDIDEFADAGRRREIKVSVLQGKIETGNFDVFLCHNSHDKPEVKKIGEQLKINGILPWLDEWELRPGLPWQRLLEEQIFKIKAAAVFVGPNGVGPWQRNELDAFLRAFVDRGCPVIPVLLPTAPKVPELPIFLQSMTWVDFRRQDPEPLERLIWGVTGERIMVVEAATRMIGK